MMDFIEKNVGDSIGIADLCAVSERSPSQVNRLFRKYLQSSPTEWVNRQKATHAKLLLNTTRLSIQEIANEFGVADRLGLA